MANTVRPGILTQIWLRVSCDPGCSAHLVTVCLPPGPCARAWWAASRSWCRPSPPSHWRPGTAEDLFCLPEIIAVIKPLDYGDSVSNFISHGFDKNGLLEKLWRGSESQSSCSSKKFGFKFLHHAAKRGILSGLWDEDEHKGWEMKI